MFCFVRDLHPESYVQVAHVKTEKRQFNYRMAIICAFAVLTPTLGRVPNTPRAHVSFFFVSLEPNEFLCRARSSVTRNDGRASRVFEIRALFLAQAICLRLLFFSSSRCPV